MANFVSKFPNFRDNGTKGQSFSNSNEDVE